VTQDSVPVTLVTRSRAPAPDQVGEVRPIGSTDARIARFPVRPATGSNVDNVKISIMGHDEWRQLLALWRQYLTVMGLADGTIGLRCYWMGRVARAFPDGPGSVTFDALVGWLAGHSWRPQTRRAVYASVRGFWCWMVETGRAVESPAHGLPRVRTPRPRPRPAPEADFRFALAIADRRVRLAIMLAGYCGLRRGEIAKVRREDMEQDLLGWTLRVAGKGGHVRLVPLPTEVSAEILRVESGWLFTSSRPQDAGKPISAGWLGKLVTRALPGDLTTHTLRHRCGTVAYASTKDIRAVQELLGHSKPEITQMYTAVADADVRAAMQSTVTAVA
jgi:integrase